MIGIILFLFLTNSHAKFEEDLLKFFLGSLNPPSKVRDKSVKDFLIAKEKANTIKIIMDSEGSRYCEEIMDIQTNIQIDFWDQNRCDKLLENLFQIANFYGGNLILVDPLKFDCRDGKLNGKLFKCPAI